MAEIRSSIFKQYAKNLLSLDHKNVPNAIFKNHSHMQIMLDILSRQKQHHILLKCPSLKIQQVILAALAQCLLTTETPKILREAFFIYFDIAEFSLNVHDTKQIENDCNSLYDEIESKGKKMIFVINQIDPFLSNNNLFNPHIFQLGRFLRSILTNPKWRLIALTQADEPNKELNATFTSLPAIKPTDAEYLTIFKSFKTELENFHQVNIPDEIFVTALTLTKHYLPSHLLLDKAYELLDTACARATYTENLEEQANLLHPNWPAVTSMHLTHVISACTSIPISYLQNNLLQAQKFVDALKPKLFGQEPALYTLGSSLQNACLKLNNQSGPLSSFLLVGEKGTGKHTLAKYIAEYLFGTQASFLQLEITQEARMLNELKIIGSDPEVPYETLSTAIRKMPYCILFIENFEILSKPIQHIFKNILNVGIVYDNAQQRYDFRHTIIIITTTLGSENIAALSPESSEKNKTLDLMQLILNDNLQQFAKQGHHEVNVEIIKSLTQHFPLDFLHLVQIIPFVPLDFEALEKIIHIKLKQLVKQVESAFNLELIYAPEVIKFLAHEAIGNRGYLSLTQVLNQHLYSCISQELIAQFEHKNNIKRLLLQLNESGQWLRCEFISSQEMVLEPL